MESPTTTPTSWVARCSARLLDLAGDEGLDGTDCDEIALDLLERASGLDDPVAAADAHARGD